MDQQPLFTETPGQVLTELCVDAVTRGDEELMALARPLLTLVRYHERRALTAAIQSSEVSNG
jgi:hypothetical protein